MDSCAHRPTAQDGKEDSILPLVQSLESSIQIDIQGPIVSMGQDLYKGKIFNYRVVIDTFSKQPTTYSVRKRILDVARLKYPQETLEIQRSLYRIFALISLRDGWPIYQSLIKTIF